VPNFAFHDYFSLLGMIVGGTLLFHLESLDIAGGGVENPLTEEGSVHRNSIFRYFLAGVQLLRKTTRHERL